MDLKPGQKLVLENSRLEVDIIGVNPTGQPFQMTVNDVKVYRVRINGKDTPLKETSLQALIDCSEKHEIKDKEPVKPNVSPLEDKEPALKKRLGRPPKKDGDK